MKSFSNNVIDTSDVQKQITELNEKLELTTLALAKIQRRNSVSNWSTGSIISTAVAMYLSWKFDINFDMFSWLF